jgi:hypothetical protein
MHMSTSQLGWTCHLFVDDTMKSATKQCEATLGLKDLKGKYGIEEDWLGATLPVPNKPATAIIMTKEKTYEDFLATLFHELVHASWFMNDAYSLEFENTRHKETQCYLVDTLFSDLASQFPSEIKEPRNG